MRTRRYKVELGWGEICCHTEIMQWVLDRIAPFLSQIWSGLLLRKSWRKEGHFNDENKKRRLKRCSFTRLSTELTETQIGKYCGTYFVRFTINNEADWSPDRQQGVNSRVAASILLSKAWEALKWDEQSRVQEPIGDSRAQQGRAHGWEDRQTTWCTSGCTGKDPKHYVCDTFLKRFCVTVHLFGKSVYRIL